MGNCISRKRGKHKDYEKVTAPKTPSKKEDGNSNAEKAEARPKLKNGSAEGSNTKETGETTGLLEQENKQKELSEGNNLKEDSKEKAGKGETEKAGKVKDGEKKTGDEKKEEILMEKEKENEEAKENLEEKKDEQEILPKENKSHGLSTSWVVFEDTTLPGQEVKGTETTIDNSGSCSKDEGDEVFQELVFENKDSEVKRDEESAKQIQSDTAGTGNDDVAVKGDDTKKDDFVEKGGGEVKDDAAPIAEPQKSEVPAEPVSQNEADTKDQIEIEAGNNTTPVFSEVQNTVEINVIRETGSTDKTKDKRQIKDEGVPDETQPKQPSQPAEANIEQGETEAKSVEKRLETSLLGIEEMARKSNTFIDMKKTVFLETRRDKKVLLQEMKITGRKINGVIAVIKSEAATEVKIRHTFDAWQSFSDTEARKIDDSDDNLADLFAFSLEVPSGKSVVFAISCKTKNGEFWDNNDGTNYGVENKKEGEDESLSTLFITGKEEAFYDRLRNTHLCLESAFVFDGKGKISIGIQKNDEKNSKVGAKYTVDSWKSSAKVEASKQSHSRENLYDIFTALVEVPEGTNKLEFAVFLEQDSAKFWDNNNGSNYSICLN